MNKNIMNKKDKPWEKDDHFCIFDENQTDDELWEIYKHGKEFHAAMTYMLKDVLTTRT